MEANRYTFYIGCLPPNINANYSYAAIFVCRLQSPWNPARIWLFNIVYSVIMNLCRQVKDMCDCGNKTELQEINTLWELPEEEWGVPEVSPRVDWALPEEEWDAPESIDLDGLELPQEKLELPDLSWDSDLDYIEEE